MIPIIAIASSALAILSDDEERENIEELLRRARIVDDPHLFLDALTREERSRVNEALSDRMESAGNFDEFEEVAHLFVWLFQGITVPPAKRFSGRFLKVMVEGDASDLDVDEMKSRLDRVTVWTDKRAEVLACKTLEAVATDVLGVTTFHRLLSWTDDEMLIVVIDSETVPLTDIYEVRRVEIPWQRDIIDFEGQHELAKEIHDLLGDLGTDDGEEEE